MKQELTRLKLVRNAEEPKDCCTVFLWVAERSPYVTFQGKTKCLQAAALVATIASALEKKHNMPFGYLRI